jgi:hypothetical protein
VGLKRSIFKKIEGASGKKVGCEAYMNIYALIPVVSFIQGLLTERLRAGFGVRERPEHVPLELTPPGSATTPRWVQVHTYIPDHNLPSLLWQESWNMREPDLF